MESVTKEDFLEYVKDTYDVLELMDLLEIDIIDIVDKFEDRIYDNRDIIKDCLQRRGNN